MIKPLKLSVFVGLALSLILMIYQVDYIFDSLVANYRTLTYLRGDFTSDNYLINKTVEQLEKANSESSVWKFGLRILVLDAIKKNNTDKVTNLLLHFVNPDFQAPEMIYLGTYLWEQERDIEAQKIFQKVIQTYPLSIRYVVNLVSSPTNPLVHLSVDNRTKELFILLSNLAFQSRELPQDLIIEIGRVLLNKFKDIGAAMDWFSKSYQIYPDNSGILFHLFVISLANNLPDSAMKYLNLLAINSKRNQWISEQEIYTYRGGLYLLMNNQREAITEFENAVKLKPSSSYAHLRLGETYYRVGRITEAIEHLELVLQLDPEPGVDFDVVWALLNNIKP